MTIPPSTATYQSIITMPVSPIIAIAQAILPLVPQLIDEIQTLANKGQISLDQQASLKAAYEALKTKVQNGTAFTGPEWTVTP